MSPHQINSFLEQLEQNLDSTIDYQALAKSHGLNLQTLQKVFPLLASLTLTDYTRRRRLTLAGKDLAQSNFRIIDIALKYGYTSAAAFSRAFYKFHHVMPSDVKRNPHKLKFYPRFYLNVPAPAENLTYDIAQTDALNLVGLEIISSHDRIKTDAPALFRRIKTQYPNLPHPDFGVLNYDLGRDTDEKYHYYALWQDLQSHQNCAEFISYHIPSTRWLKFSIASQAAADIQRASTNFYERFLPTCEYRLRPEPDLEHYHDGVTDLYIPIY